MGLRGMLGWRGVPDEDALSGEFRDLFESELKARSAAIQRTVTAVTVDGAVADADGSLAALFDECYEGACDGLASRYAGAVKKRRAQYPSTMSPRTDIVLDLPIRDLEKGSRLRFTEFAGLAERSLIDSQGIAAHRHHEEMQAEVTRSTGLPGNRFFEVSQFIFRHTASGSETDEMAAAAHAEGITLDELLAAMNHLKEISDS